MSSNELLNKESSKVGSKGYFQGKEKNPTGNTEQYKERDTAEAHHAHLCQGSYEFSNLRSGLECSHLNKY